MSININLNPISEELTIVLSVNDYNPTLLNPDFLRASGIIPSDWQLAEPPIIKSEMAQVKFINRISFLMQSKTIVFSEILESKALEDAIIPALIHKYVETTPHVDYQVVEINPTSFLKFDLNYEGKASADNYIVTALLSPSSCYRHGNKPVRGNLSLAYTLARGQFNIEIEDVLFRSTENKPEQSAVFFYGNFLYEIVGNTASERLQHLFQLLECWREDIQTYREIVNHGFLGEVSLSC